VLFNALQVYSNLRHRGPFCWGVADAGKAQGAESMHAGRVEVTAHPGVRNLCTPFGLDVGNRLNKRLPEKRLSKNGADEETGNLHFTNEERGRQAASDTLVCCRHRY
jgi:hypothetical protein